MQTYFVGVSKMLQKNDNYVLGAYINYNELTLQK